MALYGRMGMGLGAADGGVQLHDGGGPVQRDVLRQRHPCRTSREFLSEPFTYLLTGRRAQIDLQLAKQGFRLAAWLNVLFDGATHLP